MSLVAVTAGKGSPGVTTLAVALAAVWARPVLLAECDPAGGDLPFLLPAADGGRLTSTRGVVSLVAATRTDANPRLDDHVQVLAGGLLVLVGATSRAQVAALRPSWPTVVDTVAAHPTDVIADCGRFSDEDPTTRVIGAAQITVVVCRPSVSSVAHTRDVLVAMGHRGDGSQPPHTTVVVVVIGGSAEVREVGRALASHTPALISGIADDPAGARGLRGQWSPRLDRSRLVVSARILTRQLDRMLVAPQLATRATAASSDGASSPARVGG